MSIHEYVVCDGNCGKESKDFMADGWIVLTGGLTIYSGRNDHGQANSSRYISSSDCNSDRPKHFCSPECLLQLPSAPNFKKFTVKFVRNIVRKLEKHESNPKDSLSMNQEYVVVGNKQFNGQDYYNINGSWYYHRHFKITKL